jgi:hypothetical protein
MSPELKTLDRDAAFERAKQEQECALGRSLTLVEELNIIAKQCAALPIISNLSEDEILGYEEFGVPSCHGTNFALTDVKRVR